MDSPEFRCFLEFIFCGAYVPPHRTKMTELIGMKKLFQRFVHTWLISDKAHASLYTILNILYVLV